MINIILKICKKISKKNLIFIVSSLIFYLYNKNKEKINNFYNKIITKEKIQDYILKIINIKR